MDLIAFSICYGCEWDEVGVGKQGDDGVIRRCCSPEAVNMSLCDEQSIGRLILDHEKFTGSHFKISIMRGDSARQIRNSTMNITESGIYVLYIAKCDDMGPAIYVAEHGKWKSYFGYMPLLFLPFLSIPFIFALVYFAFVVHYGARMCRNVEDRNGKVQCFFMAFCWDF